MELALVVLAAGLGSRYGGLKQIEPVGPAGEIILDYTAFDARRAGFGRLVLVIRRDIEAAFRDAVGRRLEQQLDVSYVYQELDAALPAGREPASRTKPWGTAHAVLVCRDAVDGPFGVANADDLYGRSGLQVLHGALGGADAEASDFALVGYRLRDTLSDHGGVARGVCAVDASGLLTGIDEVVGVEADGHGGGVVPAAGGVPARRFSGDELVSMNLWGFTPRVLAQLAERFEAWLAGHGDDPRAECLLPEEVGALVAAGEARVRVHRAEERWVGVTYAADRPAVVEHLRALVASGTYPDPLWS